MIVLASGLLAALLFTGLPYTIFHHPLFFVPQAQAASSNPIQIENSKPGTSGWNDFASDIAPDTISGFGSKISVNHGESLDLYVTTVAPSFKVDIFRTGYYQGIGARLITSLGSFTGQHQAVPAPDKVTGIISCSSWVKSTTVTIPSDWVSGIYLAKLTSSTNKSSFIFFTVRNDGGNEDLLFQTSVTTYQAYNTWGGTSLYNNLTDKSKYSYPHATKVSFDRPFNPGDSNGAGHYFFYEYKFVYWMEQQGYNVAYTTNIDTEAHASEIQRHKGFLSVGHDEYWSMGMHNAVQNAINAGVNVAFFSANVSYWQIRFEPSAAGVANRVEVGYKDFATSNTAPGPDPLWNTNNSLVTTLWRDPVVNQPENGLLGVMYEQQEDNDYPYVVQNASSWIYAGSGFVDGSSVPGIVGYEYDRVFNNSFTPPNTIVLSNSPVHGCCGGYSSFSNSTLYTAPSGAKVFASGTIEWSLGLASVLGNTYTNTGIQKTTANILNAFAGTSTPPKSNVTFSASNLAFGNQGVNATSAVQAVKVTNSGTSSINMSKIAVTGAQAGDFTQTNDCPGSLAANASCTINTTFTPTAAGSRQSWISLTDSDTASPQVIALSGLGIASGSAVSLGATNLSFGNQTVNTTSPTQTVTITNSGTSALTFSYIQIQGLNANNFTQTNTCGTSLAVNASCKINVTFTPDAIGTRAGNITLVNNASDSPQTIVLSGTGVVASPGVAVNPLNLSFGDQTIGTSSTKSVTFTNSTGSALAISSIAITGTNASDFTQTNTCPPSSSSLATNASCTISVTFTPQANSSDARSANLVITDNGNGSPRTVSLSGGGVSVTPGIHLNPGNLTFNNQNVGSTSNSQSVTLTNNGAAPLTISSIVISGTQASDFAQTNTCPTSPSTLAVNANCTISVTFTPAAAGSRSAAITITDNSDGEGEATQVVNLNGTGVSTNTVVNFNNGFESGDFSGWTDGVSGNGSGTVQSSVVNTGRNAAQFTNAASQFTQVSTTVNNVPTHNYTRFAFRFSSLSDTTLIASGQDNAVHNQWVVYYDSGRQGLDFYFWNGAGKRYDLYTNQNAVTPNTWYTIEVEMNQVTSGHGEVWLNGNSIGNFDGDLTATQSYSKLILENTVVGTAYFDDAAIANSRAIPNSTTQSALVTPKTLDFKNQIVNTASGAQVITVTNNGTIALTMSGITITGSNASDFAQTNTCPSSLAVSTSCTINVTFTPGATGARSGSVTITDGAPDSPQSVALSGTGIASTPAVGLSPTSLTFGNQNTGTTSSAQSVVLTNSGNANLTISGITITGSNASDFVQTNTCPASLSPGTSCNLSVSFKPGGTGARSASITLANNAANSPQAIALSGTGQASPPTAKVYYNDDFESGTLNKWTYGAMGNGTATVQSPVVNKGQKAVKFTTPSNQYELIATTFSGSPKQSYTRFAFRMSGLSGTNPIAIGQDNSSHNQWVVYYDKGRQGLDISFWNAAGKRYDLYTNTNVLTDNAWYTVEIQANQTTNGHGEVWLNGTSIGAFNGDLSQSQSYGVLILGIANGGTDYFDDVIVSDSYNGKAN